MSLRVVLSSAVLFFSSVNDVIERFFLIFAKRLAFLVSHLLNGHFVVLSHSTDWLMFQ